MNSFLDNAIENGMMGPRTLDGYWIMSTGEWTTFEEVEQDGNKRVFRRTKGGVATQQRN